MSKKKCHPVKIETIPESNYELGIALSRLRYDQIVEIFAGFKDGTKEQEVNDRADHKLKLSEMLNIGAIRSDKIAQHFAIITEHFHQYLAHEYENHPRSKIAEEYYQKVMK